MYKFSPLMVQQTSLSVTGIKGQYPPHHDGMNICFSHYNRLKIFGKENITIFLLIHSVAFFVQLLQL